RETFLILAAAFNYLDIILDEPGSLLWNNEMDTTSSDAARGVVLFSSPQIEIRALVEGQMLHHRAVAEDLGYKFGPETQILVTGGASVNKSILQTIADVFNAPVHIQDEGYEAALLGAAYRSAYALYLQEAGEEETPLCYRDYILSLTSNKLSLVCEPHKDSEEIYAPMLLRYREMARVLSNPNT
ncbi:GD15162, partial [Drosophila simulans]